MQLGSVGRGFWLEQTTNPLRSGKQETKAVKRFSPGFPFGTSLLSPSHARAGQNACRSAVGIRAWCSTPSLSPPPVLPFGDRSFTSEVSLLSLSLLSFLLSLRWYHCHPWMCLDLLQAQSILGIQPQHPLQQVHGIRAQSQFPLGQHLH